MDTEAETDYKAKYIIDFCSESYPRCENIDINCDLETLKQINSICQIIRLWQKYILICLMLKMTMSILLQKNTWYWSFAENFTDYLIGYCLMYNFV